MRKILSLIFVITLFNPSVAVQAATRDHWVNIEAKKFLRYLLAKDETKLIRYVRGSKVFSENDRLHADIRAFLYHSSGPWKSVHEIAKMDSVALKLIWQKEDVVTVL